MVENREYYDTERQSWLIPENLYDTRNYALFAILADVRNDPGYESIAPRRGLPEDISPEVKDYFGSFLPDHDEYDEMPPRPQEKEQLDAWITSGLGGCSSSWATLAELASFPWETTRIQLHAHVHPRVTHLFHPNRSIPWKQWPPDLPRSYSRARKGDRDAVQWTETYAESAGKDFMDMLASFIKQYGSRSRDVRFVFWFF
jgi:hypothetical protein